MNTIEQIIFNIRWALQVCDMCGRAVTPPTRRCCCTRCGHRIKVHSNSLECRTCKQLGRSGKCGIDARSANVRMASRVQERREAKIVARLERRAAGE